MASARGGYAVACVVALLGLNGTGAVAEDAPGGEFSQIARLAAHSLLLGAARAGDRIVAVGERGHVLLSDDSAASWRQVRAPTRATLTAVTFPTPREGWAVGHDAVILHTADRGETWELQHRDPELESPLLDVWFADAERGIAVGAYGLYLATSDGGATWASRAIGETDAHLNAIAAAGDGRLYVAGEFGLLLRSDDAGASWQGLDSPYEASFFDVLPLADGGLLLAGLRGSVFRSEDGGETWAAIESRTTNSLMGGVALDDGNRVVLGGIVGTLLVSVDGGREFARDQRADRKAIAALVARPDGGIAVFGAFGADRLEAGDR